MKGRSLNNTPSVNLYLFWKQKHQLYNKQRRQDNLPEVSFRYWAYLNNICLNGTKKVHNPFL